MAIYHLNAKTGSRKNGQSAKAKADYITRCGKYARDTDDLVHTKSGNLPSWAMENPNEFWRAADTYERANASLFREVEFALPVELSDDQRRELAEAYAKMLTRDQRLPYTLAIHDCKGDNPHCHLVMSERIGDGIHREPELFFKRYNPKKPEAGGAKKADISSRRKAWLEEARKGWADLANFSLKRAGHDIKIDHRTLEAQGIDRAPETHLGPTAHAFEKRTGEKSDRRLMAERNTMLVDNLVAAQKRQEEWLEQRYQEITAELEREITEVKDQITDPEPNYEAMVDEFFPEENESEPELLTDREMAETNRGGYTVNTVIDRGTYAKMLANGRYNRFAGEYLELRNKMEKDPGQVKDYKTEKGERMTGYERQDGSKVMVEGDRQQVEQSNREHDQNKDQDNNQNQGPTMSPR